MYFVGTVLVLSILSCVFRTKSEKRQSVPQPLQHPPPPPPQFHHRSKHRNSNQRNSLSPCSSDMLISHGHSLNASSGSLSSSMSERSASTDCVEEYIGDAPFAGNFWISLLLARFFDDFFHPKLIHFINNNNFFKFDALFCVLTFGIQLLTMY